MATSLIDQLIAEARADLAARETAIVQRLITRYTITLERIQRELRTIDAQIAGLLRAGEPVPAAWLTRQRWWRDMERSIQREMLVWQQQALNGLSALQTGGVHVAVTLAGDIATAAGAPLSGQIYREAFERWVSVTQPNSPLRTISLARYEADVRQAILQRMTEGIGGGWSPARMVREIMRDIGGIGAEARIMTLARTETMRAYRGASEDTLEPLQERGIIIGYRWLATLDGNACLSCIERHGRLYPEYPTGWHVRCRCTARPEVNPDIVPGGGWKGQTGPEWFAEQDEETQRRLLISDKRYDAYRAGTPLSEMVTVRHNDIWGPSIGIRPLRDTPGVEDAPHIERAKRPDADRSGPVEVMRG